MLFNVNSLSEDTRQAAANRIRELQDFNLPELKYFNSDPCASHETPNPRCNKCGIIFRKHQKVGVAWLYTVKRGLLADSVGTGKTIQGAGLLAFMKEIGELSTDRRGLIVCRPAAVMQWHDQLTRLIPDIPLVVADGTRAQRTEKYLREWEICIMNYQMLIQDLERLDNAFTFQIVVSDDVDPLRNADNQTAYALKRISKNSARVPILTGTPLQKKLDDLYSVLEPIGGRQVLGAPSVFERRFVQKELIDEISPSGKVSRKRKVTGYKNLDEFKTLISPMVLRRTAADIDDVELPEVYPSNVFLDPYPAQMEKYEELKQGVLRIIREEGEQVKRATAIAKFLYGAQICGGLCAIGEPDRPRTSIKLDWLEDKLVNGDLSEEKVVVFINFKNVVRALHERLNKYGITYGTIWGEQRDNRVRAATMQQFWDDPNCKVLIGTTSIEQSLNLQVARHLVNVDTILNPSRMEQLAGRIRRDGSAYRSVYVHNLLTYGTQEERYLPSLEREQALIDHVWDSKSELFEALSPLALLQLIGESGHG